MTGLSRKHCQNANKKLRRTHQRPQNKRALINKTIETHLDKELYLNPQGIKVLSLFFIDTVAKYRVYDEDGSYQRYSCYYLTASECSSLKKSSLAKISYYVPDYGNNSVLYKTVSKNKSTLKT